MLAGHIDFIAKARVWMHRQGDNVFRRTPYVVAAAMQFDQRLAAMPALFSGTHQGNLCCIKDYPAFIANPATPRTAICSICICRPDKDTAIQLRNRIASEHSDTAVPSNAVRQRCRAVMFEWYVGDQMLDINDNTLRQAIDLLAAGLQAPVLSM